MRRVQKKVISIQNFMENPILGVSGPYDKPPRNAPQKTAKNGHFWVFLAKIWYLNGGQKFEFIVGDAS